MCCKPFYPAGGCERVCALARPCLYSITWAGYVFYMPTGLDCLPAMQLGSLLFISVFLGMGLCPTHCWLPGVPLSAALLLSAKCAHSFLSPLSL
jgi:hypothetical protein